MSYIFPAPLDARMRLRSNSTRVVRVKEIANMVRIKSVSAVAAVMVALLATSALPAAAQGFGPVFYCDSGTLNNCTDTIDIASSEDTFRCGGTAGEVASCTSQITGEASPYCVLLGEVFGTDRDSYLCGPEPTQVSNQYD
jgi:hypothetical protein